MGDKRRPSPVGATRPFAARLRGSYAGVWRFGAAVACLHLGYAAAFIYQSSFVIEGQRYFCLFDDAMISMRHAANWAAGHGFVWNPGERVEGYTNFGWTALMGGCHLLRLSPSHTCLLIQLLGVPILWGGMAGAILLARACRVAPVAASCALVLAMTQYNLNYYTLLGMETGLQAALVTFALRAGVIAVRARRGSIAPMLWLAAAMLVRPDVFVLVLFMTAFLLFAAPQRRWRTIAGFLVVVAVEAAHVLWRYHYYGEWLPNTYYLKATGWDLADRLPVGLRAGLWVMAALVAPTLLAIIGLARPRRWQFLLGGSFLVSFAYDVYIGGDAWPDGYRFELPTTLGLMVLAGEGICRVSRATEGRQLRAGVRWGLTAFGVFAINVNLLSYWLLLDEPQGCPGNRTSVLYVMAAEKIASADATAAVVWAGAFPYFSGRRCFDLLGKCDPYIARLPAHPESTIPGHNKYDSAYSLSVHKPDLVMDGPGVVGPEFFTTYRPVRVEVDGCELTLAVRRGSPNIRGGEPISWPVAREILRRTPRE